MSKVPKTTSPSSPPVPTPAQMGKFIQSVWLVQMVVFFTSALVFNPVMFILVQVHLYLGMRVIDRNLRRMNTCTVLAAQTFGQACKLVALSAVWPLIKNDLQRRSDEFLRCQAEEHAAGVPPASEACESDNKL